MPQAKVPPCAARSRSACRLNPALQALDAVKAFGAFVFRGPLGPRVPVGDRRSKPWTL